MKVVVVGAGPVGALAALYAANRGHEVDVYDLRDDLRLSTTTPLNFTKSINLALSERGINAVRHANNPALLDAILSDTVPMHGRMVHTHAGATAQRYDAFGRVQRAADRAALNARLLDAAEALPNVRLHFAHKLTGADFARNRAWLEVRHAPSSDPPPTTTPTRPLRPAEIEVPFDLLIGADGAHSAARFHLMKFARMSYAQEYVDTLWCEFRIGPTAAGDFAIPPHHLHIWPSPSRQFMFIAIPSADCSFTCTLFAPAAEFAALDARDGDPVAFFEAHFAGVVDELIPAEELRAQYKANPHLPLISIKCAPHAFGSSGVIVGDAAHAMLPFYGQGMNAGLEDVRVLFAHLDAATSKGDSGAEARAEALSAYTAQREPDAHAINDLASANYVEMRSAVVSPAYKARKIVEEWLAATLPGLGFATQYARVSFSNERYSDVVAAVAWQGRMLAYTAGFATGLAGIGAWTWLKRPWKW